MELGFNKGSPYRTLHEEITCRLVLKGFTEEKINKELFCDHSIHCTP